MMRSASVGLSILRVQRVCDNDDHYLSFFLMSLRPMLPADKRAMQGVWLLLLALGVFFFSSILLYVIYVALRVEPASGESTIALKLPMSFIPSSIFLIGVSGFLELAYRAARRDQEGMVKSSVILALFCGMLFMLLQSEGMYSLIQLSEKVSVAVSDNARRGAYTFTFVLVLLHALHVLFGILGLVRTAFAACRDKYDHERTLGLKFCALYWHFLDLVWIVLLIAFAVAASYLNR
ncbi:cytochrome c oxidase subunit 3 [Pirellulaceae bacterium SH467]